MIEVLKQALEALEKSNRFVWHYAHSKATARIAEQCDEAITSLRKAIQEEALRNVQRIGQEIEQEPYGWVSQHTTKGMYEWQFNKRESSVYIDTAISIVPVYTHPPQRTWVGLTIEEIASCCRESTTTQLSFAQELEAKLKQKNGYAEEKNT